jgi:hypothetical protein
VTFAALPAALVAALIAAAAIAVVLLYLLRRTPKPQVVSNVEFWLKALETSRPKWLASLRIPLLALFLSILVACSIVFLAGDPRFGAGVRGTTVVVLDVGRTMAAREDSGGRRIDHAIGEVRRWAERTTITGEVAIVRAGMRASVLLPVTDAASDLEAPLASVTTDDGPSDLDAAVALADEIVVARSGDGPPMGQIVVLTDHPVRHATRATQVVLPIGTRADTIGIASFAARRVPTAVGEYTARIAVRNYASREGHTHVVVRDGEVPLLDETIQLDANEERVLTAEGFSSARAELSAQLSSIGIAGSRDALDVDDHAFATVDPLEATRVLFVTDGDPYVEAALVAHPGLEVDVMGIAALASRTTESLASYHALVLDHAALPPGVDHAAVVVFDPIDRGPVALGTTLRNPRITGALGSHPVVSGLRFDSVHLDSARAITEASGDDVLLRSGDRVLAIAREAPSLSGSARLVVFGFATDATDLVRGESFPLLVHHALAWVTDRAEPTPLPRRLGGALVAEAGQPLRGPDGEIVDAPAGMIPTVARAGLYHVGDRAIAYGGTDLAGEIGAGATGGTVLTESQLPPLAVLVAIGLLALMLIEWTLLHRGRLE